MTEKDGGHHHNEDNSNKNDSSNTNGNDNDKENDNRKPKVKGYYTPRNGGRDVVHPGSYANKEMRDLYNVVLPELDEMQAKAEAKKEADAASAAEDNSIDLSAGINTAGRTDAVAVAAEEEVDGRKEKLPKRKVAILVQFLGTNYGGMQINEGKQSIQAEIELAIYKAGLLAATNFGFPKKYSWSNSARTDKGVHSCAQVCSVKIMFPSEDFDEVREMINAQLPDDIAVADMVKVPRSFCARTQRDKVRYQYMLPSFALQRREQLRAVYESVLLGGLNAKTTGRNVKDPFTPEEINALQDTFREYRATEENVNQLAAALKEYEGTHKFHNYTSKKKSDDASAARYILSFTVQDRVVDKYGVEWIPTLVVGQSFLLHQIRKMMSMAMDAARGASSVDIMKDSFSDSYLNVNTAPAQGLFLEMSYYDNFNRRHKAGDPLDWHSNETAPATLRWKNFKEDKIMSHIMDEEESQGNFVSYLFAQENHLKYHNYELVDEKISKTR
jgi:tRNA pseudouridine38-40 synthase